MKVFSTDQFELPLPEGHRFPIEKYRMLREKVERLPGIEVCQAPAATSLQLMRVHTRDYIERTLEGRLERHEVRRIGLPWSPALVERSLRSVGATLAASRLALSEGRAANLAGGTHHAFPHRGEGFCVFNDVAVALAELLEEKRLQRALVIDLDVHQGNGTASIFRDDPRVFTLSLHGRKNFPFHKETSDMDVELEDGIEDEEYLEILQEALARLPSWAPQLVVYLAGADSYAGDRLGRLKLSFGGLLRRDAVVRNFIAQRDCPVVLTMGGGYGRVVDETATIQARTVALFSGLEADQVEAALPAPA